MKGDQRRGRSLKGVAMMKNDWVGRPWVQIPVPAKFFTGKISIKYVYLLTFIV